MQDQFLGLKPKQTPCVPAKDRLFVPWFQPRLPRFPQRSLLANQESADLFISIHCNATGSRKKKGRGI